MNVLILDDSVIKRNRSKSVELLARVYDHVEHKCQKGFTLLTLAWSEGYRIRKESMMHKKDAAIRLIENALNAGIKAQYILMDVNDDSYLDQLADVSRGQASYLFYGKVGMGKSHFLAHSAEKYMQKGG